MEQRIIDFLTSEAFLHAIKSIGLAIIVYILGSMFIKRLARFIKRAFESSKMDPSLRPFLTSLINVSLKVLLLLAVAGTLGMQVTSFVAILSAAAFAVGIALQGSLSNFAGGVIIMVFKPFRVGDMINAQGFEGRVTEIQVFNTLLKTLDHQTIIIPNGVLSNNPIQNYSMQGDRGIDLIFGIGYGDDIDKAKQIIQEVVAGCSMVKTKKVDVYVCELGDSSVNLLVRPFVKSDDWFDAKFHIQEQVKKQFDRQGVGIPYPTMDVHVIK